MTPRLVILNFHGIGAPSRPFWAKEEAYWVAQPFFEAVLDAVQDRSDVLVTFDDANASDFHVALPALRARAMKAHFYIVSDFIGRSGFLSGSEVKELHAAGMRIGNHGKCHRSWRGLTERELDEELIEAKERLEELISSEVSFAACPNGSYDRRVLRRLRGGGYKRVYTSDRGCACWDRWLQPRNSLVRGDDMASVRGILGSRSFGWQSLLRSCKRTIKRWR